MANWSPIWDKTGITKGVRMTRQRRAALVQAARFTARTKRRHKGERFYPHKQPFNIGVSKLGKERGHHATRG